MISFSQLLDGPSCNAASLKPVVLPWLCS